MGSKSKYKIKDKGLGIAARQHPVSVKLSPEVDVIVRSLPNRSDFLREAIINELQRKGLMEG